MNTTFLRIDMMMRLFAGFIFLFFVLFFSTAQNFLPLNYDTLQRKHEINLVGSGEFAASSVSNKLTNYFIFGGEIPNDLITRLDGKQRSLNRIGFYAEPTLEYINYSIRPFKTKNWGIIVKAGMFSSGAARYTNGLFGLMFRGNEPYLGSEIDLSNMVVGTTTAHKIGFGLIDGKSKSSVSLNIYGITNYIGAYLGDAFFKQDESGFAAELLLTGGRADITSTGPYYKGIGVGVDANFFFKLGSEEKPSFLQFSIQNLGVGFINKNIVRYSMDTLIQYDGYTISNLTNGETIFGEGKNIGDELGLKRDTVSKTIALPFTVQIGKIIDEHNTKMFQFFYGGRVYIQNGAIPMLYAGAHYRSKKWFRMGIGVSYGGYTGFRANLYAQGAWKQFNIGLATSDVVGAIGLGKGYGGSLSLSYRFNN
ncbi:MAG: hypothetical protein KF704_13240 [Crocinitomicaceae bacterium]|nr:hypothetical protein [Crocinitomicaceae bacterium]